MSNESHDELDLDTLRAIAHGESVEDADTLDRETLLARLRDTAAGQPADEPVHDVIADPGEAGQRGSGLYEGEGVGRQETIGEPAADDEPGAQAESS
ncbi:MAG: hypothetical protein ACRDWI_11580 [Jiangellaceae bacterium]